MAAGGRRGSTRASSSKNPAGVTKSSSKTGEDKNRKHLTRELLTLVASASDAAHSFLMENDLLLEPAQCFAMESLLSSFPAYLSSLSSSQSPPRPLQLPSSSSRNRSPWFQRFVSSTNADPEPRWAQWFGLSRRVFSLLLSFLRQSLLSSLPSANPDSVLAASLFRLAHGASYKSIARRFDFDSSADACRAFYTVCKLVNQNLDSLFELQSNVDRIVGRFGRISLPNCCGVLGFGRFKFEGKLLGTNGSLLVQALVDSDGSFLDVSAGWPGNMKPETILYQSKLFSSIEESRELLNGPSYELSDGSCIPQYILGDSCFPLSPWLLTPYVGSNEEDDSFGAAEMEYNAAHSRARRLVGAAFARLKARWKLLGKRWKEESIEFFPFVVVTGCLLHNFLIKCNDPLPDDDVGCSIEEEQEKLLAFEGEVDERGWRIRDALAQHLRRESGILLNIQG